MADLDRRDFLKVSAAATGGVLLSGCSWMNNRRDGEGTLARRPLGRTGETVSIIGFGGLVARGMDQQQANDVIGFALDNGVDYFESAPTYADTELLLGEALKSHRKNIIMGDKTVKRDRKGAAEKLQASLKRMQTDHFDLYLLHGIRDVEKDVHAALGKGGAMEAILEAKRQGQVRFIGFSAHTPEAALAAMREFDFDCMMYPINFCLHYRKKYEVQPLAEARKRNMGVLAIKGLAKQKWPEGADRGPYKGCWYQPASGQELSRLALSWTLDQNVSVAIPPANEELFRRAVEIGQTYRPLTDAQRETLKETAADLVPIF